MGELWCVNYNSVKLKKTQPNKWRLLLIPFRCLFSLPDDKSQISRLRVTQSHLFLSRWGEWLNMLLWRQGLAQAQQTHRCTDRFFSAVDILVTSSAGEDMAYSLSNHPSFHMVGPGREWCSMEKCVPLLSTVCWGNCIGCRVLHYLDIRRQRYFLLNWS